MKRAISAIVIGLAVSVLYCPQQTTAGGELQFLSLSSFIYLYGDDGLSPPISTEGAFPFGTGEVDSVYVSTNGYISMGTSLNTFTPTIPGTDSIVAPYGADINSDIAGVVRYTLFTNDFSQLNTVSSFIRSETNSFFSGTRMMIADWHCVAEFEGTPFTTVRFQAVLITDGSCSYAVFIYHCGGMLWSGAEIGWQYSSSLFEEHPLSGADSSLIGCLYSCPYSAIVFKLSNTASPPDPPPTVTSTVLPSTVTSTAIVTSKTLPPITSTAQSHIDIVSFTASSPLPPSVLPCSSNQWRCDNGQCIPINWFCDVITDCGDSSDEYPGCANCSSSDWECDNGECINSSWVCDGYYDCGDYSDEYRGCAPPPVVTSSVLLLVGSSVPPPPVVRSTAPPPVISTTPSPPFPTPSVSVYCPSSGWQCDNGECINNSSVCDGYYDCLDYSDEYRGCGYCYSYQWQCNNGECIYSSFACDGKYDCLDLSDEYHGCGLCYSNEWQCGNGQCIPSNWFCDGITDCGDDSDEYPGCVVSSESPTPTPTSSYCSSNQWQCDNGDCIPSSSVCDGYYDCQDSSDEYPGCVLTPSPTPLFICFSNQWRCDNGDCIPSSSVCDGYYDCQDSSDEYHGCAPSPVVTSKALSPYPTPDLATYCLSYEWQCNNGECIPRESVCDGRLDCRDSSDELHGCEIPTSATTPSFCTTGQWQCGDGGCIASVSVCDGRANCGDGSDEKGCA